MPAPNIKSVLLTPNVVSAGQSFKITVEAESIFLFNDLDTMTWNTVETRNLTWDNIDDTE